VRCRDLSGFLPRGVPLTATASSIGLDQTWLGTKALTQTTVPNIYMIQSIFSFGGCGAYSNPAYWNPYNSIGYGVR